MSQNLMTPKGMMALLYNNFDDVHQAAISHVVTDENGDHLYLALIRSNSGEKQHQGGAGPAHRHRPEHTMGAEPGKAAGATASPATGATTATGATAGMPVEPNVNAAGSADELDVSLSRQLVNLLHRPITWDACTDKQHCGGAGPAHRPRRQHEPRVPAAHAHHAVEGDAAIENGNPATTVSDDDVAGLFKVMDRVSAYGLKETPVTHGGDAA